MPLETLRVAIAQVRSSPVDVRANAAASARTIADVRERGAELVVFPELSLTGYELPRLATMADAWLEPHDARLEPIRRACVAARVTAVLGAPMRVDDGTRRIAALIVDPTGAVQVSFKEHLHGSEVTTFQPGTPAAPFLIGSWRVAVAVCFDAARPRHAENAALAGADLYLVSALYVTGEEHRADLHLGARAMDHRMFAALANHAGTTGGHVSCGGSGVWSPSGLPLTRAADADETLLVADLDPARLHAYR